MRTILKKLCRPAFRPWLSRSRFHADARRLGVRDGIPLLVHSSLSSLGYVPAGPHAVLQWLQELVGESGTLVLPTHTWNVANAGGRTFDARRTPSCVGTLTELFRTLPDVVRSLHPSHSVAARGAAAEVIIAGHLTAETPCGLGTPYEKLLGQDGQVLLLGVGLKSHTCFHTVEALAELDYLMDPHEHPFEVIDSCGAHHAARVRLHAQGIRRRFGELEQMLVDGNAARRGLIGPAQSLLVEGPRFLELMVPALRQRPDLLLAGGGLPAAAGTLV